MPIHRPNRASGDTCYKVAIKRAMVERHMTMPDIAESVGFSPSTLGNRMRTPGNLTVDELFQHFARGYINKEEIVKIVTGEDSK